MHKHIIKLLTALALIIGVLAFAAPAANAESAHAKATAQSMGAVDVNTSITSANVVNTNAQGKIVGSWFKNPKGKKEHWKPKKAKKVPFAKSYNKGARTCKPFRLKKGKWMPRTLKMRNGQPFQVKGGYKVKTKWTLFDMGKGCQPRHRGYWTGKKWVNDCVNPKPKSSWPVIPASKVVEVKQHNEMNWSLAVAWNASAPVYGAVEVDCGDSRSKSSFTAKGETTGRINVTVKAKTRTEAQAKAAQQVKLNVKSKTSVKATLMASGEANAAGNAEASCESNPLPVVPAPQLLEIETINFVLVGNSRTIAVSGKTANGHDGELYCQALNGGTVTSATKRQTVSGSFTKSINYVAPGEIPDVLKDGDNVIVPAGHDMVECTLTQDDDQKVTIRTTVGPGKFEIKQPAPESE